MSGIIAGAAVIGGATIYAARESRKAGEQVAQAQTSAAEVEAAAAREALQFQKDVYGDIQPYLMASLSGYSSYLESPEKVRETPGYLFRLQEGLRAVGIPQGGRQLSGPQIRRALQYGQDYATAEYQNALARIAGLGSLAQGVYGAGQSYATAAGNILQRGAAATAGGIRGAGEARAAGRLGAASAIGQGLQQGMLLYGLYNMRQPQIPGATTPTGAGTAGAGSVTTPITNYYGGGYVPPGGSFNTPGYGYNTELGAEGTGFATY